MNASDFSPKKGFQKGQSGNPAGKARGTLNRLTRLRLKFAEDNSKDLLGILWGHALQHPQVAMFLAERLFPGKDWTAHHAQEGTTSPDDANSAHG